MRSVAKQHYMSGQAMTETLITASTILVPLLLLIPLLGKYIDMKHAAIQAARYEAWEYTVWYSSSAIRDDPFSTAERSSGFVDGGGDSLSQPIKSTGWVQTESRRRFFSDTTSEITPTDGSGSWSHAERNPLWTDHQGNSLVKEGSENNADAPKPSEATPDLTGGVMNVLLDILSSVFDALAWAMSLAGSDVGFTMINTDGTSVSEVLFPIKAPEGLIDFPNISDTPGIDDSAAALDMDVSANAAVLTDGWNAGGLGHTINQTGGMVPTKILAELIEAIPGLNEVWDVVSLLVPEWRRCNPSIGHFLDVNYGTVAKWEGNSYNTYEDGELSNNGSLWLGYMNIDAIHPDRLDVEDGTHDCPDNICNYDPEPVFADCEL